jgi:hypothetical protein
MKNLVRAQVLFFGFLFAAACSSAPPPPPAAADVSPQAIAPPAPSPTLTPEFIGPAPAVFKKTFIGTIGENLAVQMDIERDKTGIQGNYFYDKPGAYNLAGKLLDLKGKVDNEGTVTLNESNQDPETGEEKQTGVFKGKLDSVTVNNIQTLRLIGEWTGAKSKKALAVNLREQVFDLGGLQITEKKLKEGGKKFKYMIGSSAPQLVGDDTAKVEKFNKTVLGFITRRTGEFKKSTTELLKEEAAQPATLPKTLESRDESKPEAPAAEPTPEQLYTMEVSYTITAATKDYISVLFYFYEYSGGAHPNTTTNSFNYDLNRNEALRLPDLFAPKANYLKTISDYCIKELKKLKTVETAEEGAGPDLEKFKSWNIAPSGLRITFDRYQVAAYAAGDHEVVIPFATLKPLLKPDSVIAPLAN